MRLLLFDIDGTLLRADGAGRRAVARTFEEIFGTAGLAADLPMAGMTDPLIARACLEVAGYSHAEIEARLPQVWVRYAAHLADELARSPARPCPGVRPLLERLATRDDLVLGLLTGNIEPTAWLKVQSVDLHPFFRFGAFGNEGPEREKLPAVAVAKAAAATGYQFSGPDIVIIGDTPHDIHCGRHLAVRTVAVCTGPYGADALHEATVVLPSLADTDAAVAALLG